MRAIAVVELSPAQVKSVIKQYFEVASYEEIEKLMLNELRTRKTQYGYDLTDFHNKVGALLPKSRKRRSDAGTSVGHVDDSL